MLGASGQEERAAGRGCRQSTGRGHRGQKFSREIRASSGSGVAAALWLLFQAVGQPQLLPWDQAKSKDLTWGLRQRGENHAPALA